MLQAAHPLRSDFIASPEGAMPASSAEVVRVATAANAPEAAPGAVLRAVPVAKPGPVALPARTVVPLLGWIKSNLAGWLLGALSIGGVLLFWYLATRYKLDFYVRFMNIPSPGDVLDKVIEVNRSAKFINNVGISVRRILLGFFVATGLGIALGLLIGRYRLARGLMLPALEVFRPIPAIAWVPMSIMLWPDNEVSIVFITFLGAFFPILLNTIHGVESIDKVLLRAARCLGTTELPLFTHVILPGALPHIFTGLAVGMGVAWVSLIAAEMISGQFGIGYFTWEAYSLISYAEIALGMITIGVLGLICSGAIRIAGKVAMPWLSFSSGGAQP